MRKVTKRWLVIATSCIILASVLFAGVMTVLRWDFTKLSTLKLETNEHAIRENFSCISVETDTADIFFVPSDDETCRVVCYEDVKAKHTVSIQNGTLVIALTNEKAWYDYINFNFVSPKITVYLPRSEYNALVVKTSTGDVQLPKDFSFQSIDVRASTGDVHCYASATEALNVTTTTGDIWVESLSAGSLDLTASTGKVSVSAVVCDGAIRILVSTGRVSVSEVDCKGELQVKVSTGKAIVSKVQCQSFTSTGDTGALSLEHVVATDSFSIERDTGDVRFAYSDATTIHVTTDTGNVTGSLLSSKRFDAKTSTGRISVPDTTEGGTCMIRTDTGDIKIQISKP